MSAAPSPEGPGAWRRLGLGTLHPGAARPWALVALGLLLDALSMPPGPVPALVLVADAPFLWLVFAGSRGRWKRWTLLYGVLHFAIALRWLRGVHPAEVAAVGIVLGPVYLLAAAALRLLVRRRVPWLLAVGAVLVGEEMLRTVWFGGMPWPARSLAFAGSERLVASASFLGAYALSFLAATSSAVASGLPSVALAPRGWRGAALGRVLRVAPIPALLALLLAVVGGARVDGYLARRQAGVAVSTTGQVLVAIQGNIPQSLKHAEDPGTNQRVFDRHLDVSREALRQEGAAGREVIAVLWPETMVPWPFVDAALGDRFPEAWENQVRVLQNVAALAAEQASWPLFLLGVIHHFDRDGERHAWLHLHGTHDSLLLVDPRLVPPADREPPGPPPAGVVPPWELGRHDKRVLVPGGEYTPLGDLLPFLRVFRLLVSEIPELDPGTADQVPFALASVPQPERGPDARLEIRAGTVICFEVAFPAACRSWRRRGAHVLLNAANYGWFGPSSFRAEIRALARLRAAETGTSIVMAGNTGPTLFVDPVGRPYGRFTSWPDGEALDPASDEATLREGWTAGPLVADPDTPPYVRWGDLPWLALFLVVAGLALRGGGRPTDRPPGATGRAPGPAEGE